MSETFDLSSLFQGSATAQLQRQFVGSEHNFAPNTKLESEWVAKDGSLLSRTEYAVLWEWVQRTQAGNLLSDSAWQAKKTSSPIGAVANYSIGDGSTNFRVPTTGKGGFSRSLGTDGATVGTVESGFDDQIQNLVGTFTLHGSADGTAIYSVDGVFSNSKPIQGKYKDGGSKLTGSAYSQTIVDFNASSVARTGTETTPQGFYVKTFIYTGRDIPNYTDLSVPRVVGKNLLINGDFSVWQRGTSFTNTSWAYTVDRWQVRGRTGLTNRRLVSGSLGSLIRLDVGSSFPAGEHTAIQQRIEDVDYNLLGKTTGGYTYTLSFATQATGAAHGGRCYASILKVDDNATIATTNMESFAFGDRVNAVLNLPQWSLSSPEKYILVVYIETNPNPPVGGYNIANVKLEEGSVATPFVPDDPATNLAKCQRYYQYYSQSHLICLAPERSDATNPSRRGHLTFSTPMRIEPSVTVQVETNVGTSIITRNVEGLRWSASGMIATKGSYLQGIIADAEL